MHTAIPEVEAARSLGIFGTIIAFDVDFDLFITATVIIVFGADGGDGKGVSNELIICLFMWIIIR
jgi:hypothetical protein